MDPKEISPKTTDAGISQDIKVSGPQTQKVKKIVGIFLVKQVSILSYHSVTSLIIIFEKVCIA